MAHVSRPGYQPVKPRVIARQMKLNADDSAQVRVSVKRLVQRGKLLWGPRHAVCLIGTPNERPQSAHPGDETRSETDRDTRDATSSAADGTTRRANRDQRHPTSSRKPAAATVGEPGEEPGKKPGKKSRDRSPHERASQSDRRSDESRRARRDAAIESEGDQTPRTDSAQPATARGGKRTKRRRGDDVAREGRRAAGAADTGDATEDAPVDRGAAGREGDTKQHRAGDSARDFVRGTFRRTKAGDGFVRPVGTTATDRSDDIYIPGNAAKDASDGDHVTVRLSGRRRRGRESRISGEIVAIVERASNRFVGVYSEEAGEAFVQVDGKVFNQPISVGDPGAKDVAAGDKVVIEMVRFPTHYFPGEAVVVENLGARGQSGVDTLSIIREFNLPEEFPEDVLEAARQQAEAFDETNLRGRHDYTAETVITIDPVDARDFDDAISLDRLDNGHWQLGVHIADVGHFVPARSPLDREARERGTSVYLPDRVIPMLPEIISNNLASLQPGKVRYCHTVVIEFTGDGVPVATHIHRAAMKSCRRFTYEEIDDFLADPRGWTEKLTPEVHRLVTRMHELAMILRERRLKAGAIELTLPEVKIDLDRQGKVCGAHVVENTTSHQIIEEFMLAANEAVAEHLARLELPFLRRVHGAPDPNKLRLLSEFVREMGIPCDSLESRFEIKRVIEAVKGRPAQQGVNYAILRSMQKAVYGPQDEGHYALNSRNYCHFTSPIRRYPDLVVHRLLEALAHGRRPHDTLDRLIGLGDHCSQREQRAAKSERELVKVKLLAFLSERVGERMEAVITGVESFGIFAQGIDIPAEGLISIQSMQDDYYRYDSRTHSLVGHRAGHAYRLGDQITVEIGRVDIDRRELDLRLVKRGGRPPRVPKPDRAREKQDRGKHRKRRTR